MYKNEKKKKKVKFKKSFLLQQHDVHENRFFKENSPSYDQFIINTDC
jgi:hypothetical protein